jgi:transposase
VFECGAQSPWIAHHLTETNTGLEVVVANARKVEIIARDTRKCDAHDAESLARLGRADIALLHPVKHRGLAAQEDLALVRMRDVIVRQRVGLVNCVRGLLKSTGQEVPAADPDAFARKCRLKLPENVIETVGPMLLVLEACAAQVKALERKIETIIAQRYPEAARLREVDGVGPITALTFVLTIDDAGRFKRTRDVGAFLGLVPRRDQSGMRDKALPISKCGDRYLRRLLVNCAQYLLGPFGKPCDLRQHGLDLIGRLGPNSRKRVAIAIARKLAVTLLSMLKTGSDWKACRKPTPPQPEETKEAA